VYPFPFYYVDYDLAICCALQLWLDSFSNHEAAVNKWLRLCSLGGTLGFQALLDCVSIRSPFQPGTLPDVIREAVRVSRVAS